jgi:hypothetical protein
LTIALGTERALLTRFSRRIFAFICGVLLLSQSATYAGNTVLQYSQVSATDTVTATDNGSGTTTLATTGIDNGGNGVSIYVQITNFLGTTESSMYAYETYVGVTSVGPASIDPFSGNLEQKFTGEIEFTSGVGGAGDNYLTAVFSSLTGSPVFAGAASGASGTLAAAEPSDSLVLTSQYAPLLSPTGMAIWFSNLSPELNIAGDGSLASFTAQNAGTFSATIDPSSVPEPGTLSLESLAIVIATLAHLRQGLRKQN